MFFDGGGEMEAVGVCDRGTATSHERGSCRGEVDVAAIASAY